MTFAGEFLGLPGLRGYWPMSAFDSSGNAIDQSGNARTLTYNGNPTYNYTTQGGPYCDYDGTGDYHSRADEAGLKITGTETYVATAQRGLTLGGWFWFDSTAGQPTLLGKHDNASATGSAYLLYMISGAANLVVYNSSSIYEVVGSAISTGQWYFVAGRYTPSSELAIWVNETKTTDTSPTPPASLNDVAAAFQIGGRAGGSLIDGRAGMCFACAMILTDTAIDNIYQNTKAFYGL